MQEHQTIVVVTGAAPYLGGPETWKPLRNAANDFEFIEIDPLVFAANLDAERDYEEALVSALQNADAVVAHAGAARVVIEVAARVQPDIAVLLLSPMLIERMTPRLRIFRRVFAWPPAARMLTGYAKSKYQRLCGNRSKVMKELRLFAGSAVLTDTLVTEAQSRFSDPRAESSIERTAQYLQYATKPIDPKVNAMVQNRRVLLGVGLLDRKISKRMTATVIESATGALMLEAPALVAQSLREMLAGPVTTSACEL